MQFKNPTIRDRELIQPYLVSEQRQGCENTFANVLFWSPYFHTKYTLVEDALVFRSGAKQHAFSFPLGASNPKKIIQCLMDDCGEKQEAFGMYGLTQTMTAQVEAMFPGQFVFEAVRDDGDYIYETQALISLSGKKYHSKRNFIRRFKKDNDWSYEPITEGNMRDCLAMNDRWCEENGCHRDPSLLAEQCVVRNSFRYFSELGLRGGLLRVDGRVVAFTIGEPLNRDTFVVHVEKAFSSVVGAYPTINQEFLRREAADFVYVNREEDMGVEGLRKAKLSYHPVYILEKSIAKLR